MTVPSPPRPSRPLAAHAAAEAKEYSLHPLERTLAAVVIALLVFLPWALGGMRLPPQLIAGGLALLAFAVALVPRHYDERHHAGGHLRLVMWPKLLRFPFFWLGLLWFALICCQNLNPAWIYHATDNWWRLEPNPHVTWLPHGVAGAPFAKMSGWRTLLIHGTVWLLVCALWVGVVRRKTARVILTVTALNGVLIAATVLAQRVSGNGKFLWLWEPPAPSFVAGFTYKNHGGEFLGLILALCLGFAWWHTRQAERTLAKSHPGFVWLLLAGLVVVGQLFTYARAASMAGVAFFIVILLAYLLRQVFRRSGGMPRPVTAAAALLAAGFMTVALTQLETERVVKRFGQLRLFNEENPSFSVSSRQLATRATLDLAAASPVFGHGAGSYRYLFPEYQKHYPDIWMSKRWDRRKKEFVPHRILFWEYAHNDYAQLRAEFGWTGVVFAGITVLLILGAAWRRHLSSQTGLLVMLGGVALVAATAAVDFPMHNPAILVTTAGVIVLVLRWAELSGRR